MNQLTKRIEIVEADMLSDDIRAQAKSQLSDPDYSGKVQLITGYAYDMLGKQVKQTDPLAYLWDESDAARRPYETRYTYDELNRVKRIIRQHQGQDVYTEYGFDAVGNRVSVRNELGHTTTYAYEAMNRLVKVTDPKGFSMTYAYDLAGNKIADTNDNGDTMSYAYDKLNRLTTVKDAYNVVIDKRIYDVNGNLIKQMDAKGVLSASSDAARYGWTYTYDLANRMVTKLDPEAGSCQASCRISLEYIS